MSNNFLFLQTAGLGDYVFLILIILASIFQSINQNKKKREMAEMGKKQADEDSSDEESFPREFIPKLEEVEIPAAPSQKFEGEVVLTEKGNHPYQWDDDYSEEEPMPIPPVLNKFQIKSASMIPDPGQSFSSQVPASPVAVNVPRRSKLRQGGFTLRKAVVYSEILNQKYS